MPNWNTTDVRVNGPVDQISKLYDIMYSLEYGEKELLENGFGNTWYGCLVHALGEDWNQYYCRGSWDSVNKENDNLLSWFDETAWGPMTEVFNLIEEKFPDVKVYWIAEEPGMGYYVSNDVNHKYFNTRFILCFDDCERIEYFESEQEMLDFINQYLNGKPDLKSDKPISSLEELDAFVENCEDMYYSPFTYKEI